MLFEALALPRFGAGSFDTKTKMEGHQASRADRPFGLISPGRAENAKRAVLCPTSITPDVPNKQRLRHNKSFPVSGMEDSTEEEDHMDSIFQPAPLRKLIERLECTLSDRFDFIESRLDLLGEEIVGKVLCSTFSQESPGDTAPTGSPSGAQNGNCNCVCPNKNGDFSEQMGTRKSTDDQVIEVHGLGEEAVESRSTSSSEATSTAPYSLRPEWQTSRLHPHMQRLTLPEHSRTLEDMDGALATEAAQRATKPWYIVWPNGRLRTAWDLTTMMLIFQDMAVIPVNLAFGTGSNPTENPLYWPLLLFWTADIPLTFVTGVQRHGKVETCLWKIARAYLLTWFVLDACMVGSAWSEFFIGSQTRGLALGRVGKTLRILRVMRSMRLLRLVKMRRIIEDMQASVTSEYIHIIMSVFKLILIIVWTNHFIGCMWWAIGSSGPRQGDPDAEWSWTSHFEFQNDPVGYQYLTALHWSLTQFTPASMEVSPCNLGERFFAVLVLLFAMIVFSSFVSSITAAMTQLRQLSSSLDKSRIILRRYLRARNTPGDLNVRIVKCVEHRINSRKNDLTETDVTLLQYLSKPLQMELLYHIYAKDLMEHPFFRYFGEVDPVAMQRVCLVALQRISLCPGDALFSEACSGNQMFFVKSGKLRYFTTAGLQQLSSDDPQQQTSGNVSDTEGLPQPQRNVSFQNVSEASAGTPERSQEVKLAGEWFCESSLWCTWTHCGTMVAENMTDVLALDATSFANVTSQHPCVPWGASDAGRTGGMGQCKSNTKAAEPDEVRDRAVAVPVTKVSRPVAGRRWRGLDVCSVHPLTTPVGPTKTLLLVSAGSVVDFQGDAIVNAANEGCLSGGGVDGAITAAGGKAMAEARLALPIVDRGRAVRCPTGEARTTTGGDLKARYCIHAVGPDYNVLAFDASMTMHDCDVLVKKAYKSALDCAQEQSLGTIAFSLISASIFRGRQSLENVLIAGITGIQAGVYDGLKEVHLVAFTKNERMVLEQICGDMFPYAEGSLATEAVQELGPVAEEASPTAADRL